MGASLDLGPLDAGFAQLNTVIEGDSLPAITEAASIMVDEWKATMLPHSHTFQYYGTIQDEIIDDKDAVVFVTAVRLPKTPNDHLAPYPEYVEYGTDKMAPRGYARISFARAVPKIEAAVGELYGESIDATFVG